MVQIHIRTAIGVRHRNTLFKCNIKCGNVWDKLVIYLKINEKKKWIVSVSSWAIALTYQLHKKKKLETYTKSTKFVFHIDVRRPFMQMARSNFHKRW